MRADHRTELGDGDRGVGGRAVDEPVGDGLGLHGRAHVVDGDIAARRGGGDDRGQGELLQPGDRLGGGPHLLQRGDMALGEGEDRLDRQGRAEQGGGRADPAAPT